MKKSKKIIELLNDLVRINIDRVAGYEKGTHADKGVDPGVRNIFYKLAMQSRSYINELHAEVLHLGGSPVGSDSNPGELYPIWLEFKVDFSGKDTQSLLMASEAGETAVQKAYQFVLDKETDLPYNIVCLIRDQQIALKKAFDLVKRYHDFTIIHAHHN
jgi:uncharacterized protein (TIGR02284 family)